MRHSKSDLKQYGAKVKISKEEDRIPALSENAIKLLKHKIGILLFYATVVYITLLVALLTLKSAQVHGTEAMANAMVQILSHCDINTDSAIQYKTYIYVS